MPDTSKDQAVKESESPLPIAEQLARIRGERKEVGGNRAKGAPKKGKKRKPKKKRRKPKVKPQVQKANRTSWYSNLWVGFKKLLGL